MKEAPYAFGATYEREAELPDEGWREVVRRRTRFVAEVEGEIAGTVSGGPAGWPGASAMTAMWVDPRFRRQGVADRLVKELIEWARRSGYEQMLLCVRDGNVAAERLYERNGFARTGRLCSDAPRLEHEMGRGL